MQSLDFNWAEKRWTDPVTKTEMVCLSPPCKRHYRNNYFRINQFTDDGQWMVMLEAGEVAYGCIAGTLRVLVRNLVTGETRVLGEVAPPPKPIGPGWYSDANDNIMFTIARRSHKVNVTDFRAGEFDQRLIQFDIDTGSRRDIQPSERINFLYEPSFDATERYTYTPMWSERWERRRHMDPADFNAMMAAQPGLHHMVRIDLDTGEVQRLFSAESWWMGHPNPHPMHPDLFMCCQEWGGEIAATRWGRAKEHERIRVLDLATGQWDKRKAWEGAHEHWAPRSRRIYAHQGWVSHEICRSDLDAGTVERFFCLPGIGGTYHATVAPDESFLVGEGTDKAMIATWMRGYFKQLAETDPVMAQQPWLRDVLKLSPGETVWKYELPPRMELDPADYPGVDGMARAVRDLQANPDMAVRTIPICTFRSLTRTLFKDCRLESNAHVTPDSRWVVFQSSSEDDWFEIWAAKVPGA
ncbi:MAG: hypothetical protein IT440_09535 [Phycisphaeraceae bacterium]|nr:hypothetical protein [Phycisphaeraceae bacterium]